MRIRRDHRRARRGAGRRALRERIGIARIDDHDLLRAAGGGDVQLHVEKRLVDVEAIAAAHRRPSVFERVPHDAKTRGHVVVIVRDASQTFERGLQVIAHAEVERQIRPEAPRILREHREEVVGKVLERVDAVHLVTGMGRWTDRSALNGASVLNRKIPSRLFGKNALALIRLMSPPALNWCVSRAYENMLTNW